MSNSQTPEPGTERILRSTTRNPRRRQRQSDNDSTLPVQAPKRRKRDKVSEQTFKPRDSTENINPDTESPEADGTTVMNGHPPRSAPDTRLRTRSGSIRSTPNLDAPMTIRGAKAKRPMRSDGATTLAQNQCYSVKMLPSTPKELRKEDMQYRGSLGGAHQALAVTHEKAIIWNYTAHQPPSNPQTFEIPFPYKAGGSLPFGALVSQGSNSSDLGLLLVSATTGQVVFYDSIERAASLGLFQDRKRGTEGNLTGLFTGETVVDLISADHAGFVVLLSSGRLAHLTLRDAQGKPRIQNQFLRATDPAATSFLGSFTGFFKGGFRKDLSTVHTRPLHVRGQMQAVALDEKAEILIWDMDWSGRSEFRASIDCREILVDELRELEMPEVAGRAEQLQALDFAFLDKNTGPRGDELATVGAEQPLNILLLLRVGSRDMHTYVVAELSLRGGTATISRITQLRKYVDDAGSVSPSKPSITIPKPGHTVFITFENAMVLLAAKVPQEDSPEAQLNASLIQPETYEEAVFLRRGKNLEMQSAVAEDAKAGHAASIVFVKSAGLIRVSSTDVNSLPGGARIPAKSRIEQAVFYGSMQQDNIIDYSRKIDAGYSVEEVQEAALAISREVMGAETAFTTFISPTPQDMEPHLIAKGRALKALAGFVRQNYPSLSPTTMWRLLWDAERVAAAHQLWIAYQEHINNSIENNKRKATILDELCSWFDNSDQPEPFFIRRELADEGDVKKFFIGGLHRIELLLNMARVLLQSLRSDKEKTPLTTLRLVFQANDVWIRTLQTTFDFRSEHCAEYGILPELIEDGILIDPVEYVGLPDFWTSNQRLINNTIEVTKLSTEFATDYYQPETMPEAAGFSRDVAVSNPKLVQLYCLQAQEGIHVRQSRPALKDQESAKILQREFDDMRYELCRQLAIVGQTELGMQLAEQYRDMRTLTDMVLADDQYLAEELLKEENVDNIDAIHLQQHNLESKVRRCFDRYGKLWSDAFFDKLFSNAELGSRLGEAQIRWKKALTKYLRDDPRRAKICWINDVTGEQDFAHASEALAESAVAHESKMWAKKVELSLSKLALLASQEGTSSGVAKLTNGSTSHKHLPPQAQLMIVEIQEKLDAHIRPELLGFIDREAELQHCTDNYGGHVSDYPALRQILEHSIEMVLDHKALSVEELIDVLTLMDMNNDDAMEGNLTGTEFFYALVALDAVAPSMPSSRFETLLNLIWKRCYIYDDWAELQLAKKKSDEERKQELRHTATWHTLFHALESDFFAKPDRHVRIVAPSDCLGAACQPQDLSYRFPNEDLLHPILHDLKLQDELLQSYVADRKLDEVAQECLRDAKAHLENKAEERAKMLEQERDFEESFSEDAAFNSAAEVGMNGHAKGMNGFGSSRAEYVDESAHSDVEME